MAWLWIPHCGNSGRESTVRMNYCGFSNRFPASIRRAMISNNSSMDNINCGSIRCQCNTDGHISVTSIVLQHCVTMQHQLWLDQVPVRSENRFRGFANWFHTSVSTSQSAIILVMMRMMISYTAEWWISQHVPFELLHILVRFPDPHFQVSQGTSQVLRLTCSWKWVGEPD